MHHSPELDLQQFENRKRDHLRHALNSENQATGMSGLDGIRLVHEALPELDFAEVSLVAQRLGREAKTPFFIAAMTAGHAGALALNRELASACQERGWAMGVGSQRRDLEADSRDMIDRWGEFRAEFDQLSLFANIGMSQLCSVDPERVVDLAVAMRADAIAVHANALQEALQPEGTPRFSGAMRALKQLIVAGRERLNIPVILKETGCGFSESTLRRVAGLGLAAVDVSGFGGTHWGRIEGARAGDGSLQARASQTFANWGETTAQSVMAARRALSETEIWASGGVRSGLDAAKLIALGADQVGYAQPALAAATRGPAALRDWMGQQEYELKIALFCTGSKKPAELKAREGAWTASIL